MGTLVIKNLTYPKNIPAVNKGEPKKVQGIEWPKDDITVRPRRKAISARLLSYIEI